MLGFATLGTDDLDRAAAFYDDLLRPLGAKRLIERERGIMFGIDAPAFGILRPFDGRAAGVGNGTMLSLIAASREMGDEVYAQALGGGATDEGAPGLRGDDPNGFYSALFRDLDGHKLCIYHWGPA